MPNWSQLISVFEEARRRIDHPDNDFTWSFWEDREDALEELDRILSHLRTGVHPNASSLELLFAPTGPLQEVSLSSGWGDDFCTLAGRFDEAMASDDTHKGEAIPLASPDSCPCMAASPLQLTWLNDLGMDSRFAEVSVHACGDCGRHWLRYFYEVEAVTGSGRWYLGAVPPDQLSALTPENAKAMLEELPWYYYGGSCYNGQTGKASGKIDLNP